MNKQELINNVAFVGEMSKKDAEHAIKTVFEVIETAVSNGEKVQIIGHGTYELKDVPAKSGVSKLTGVEVPWSTEASKKPVFNVGKTFLDKCNL